MCHNGKSCPHAHHCYRWLATPSEYQTVANFYNPDRDCEHFWKISTKEELKRLEEEWQD